jgi:GNAT superfamily N-acetyltransferase
MGDGTSPLALPPRAPRCNPALGGLGEVATVKRFRRRGIASDLCGLARDEFRKLRGRVLFLGTGNPDEARVYHRLGWRKLTGTNVMALIAGGEWPEAFLSEYFRPGGPQSSSP